MLFVASSTVSRCVSSCQRESCQEILPEVRGSSWCCSAASSHNLPDLVMWIFAVCAKGPTRGASDSCGWHTSAKLFLDLQLAFSVLCSQGNYEEESECLRCVSHQGSTVDLAWRSLRRGHFRAAHTHRERAPLKHTLPAQYGAGAGSAHADRQHVVKPMPVLCRRLSPPSSARDRRVCDDYSCARVISPSSAYLSLEHMFWVLWNIARVPLYCCVHLYTSCSLSVCPCWSTSKTGPLWNAARQHITAGTVEPRVPTGMQ